jgi:hypothetical protein
MTSKPTGPVIPLPFIRDFKTGRGGPRRSFWAIKPTGDDIVCHNDRDAMTATHTKMQTKITMVLPLQRICI